MRENFARHLGHLFTRESQNSKLRFVAAPMAVKKDKTIPPEFNAKDWVTFLLHVDAELEHSLMVQYLYAAYSMGGNHIEPEHRELVKGWQEIILGIAKEEMGHFVSVQNVLRVIGAPLNFNRQDFPWDSNLYPFEFRLEPLSIRSLAKYIYAESPSGWLKEKEEDDDETKAIKKEIRDIINADKHGDPISELFEQIIHILEDESLIPDEVFLVETYPYQAKFDEWGRGYAGGSRGNSTNANTPGAPNVLVQPVGSRTQTVSIVKEIAEQGEAASDEDNQLSHFERFLGIYKQWRKLPDTFNPARNIAINPTIADGQSENENAEPALQKDLITNPEAQLWANLFNVRYRMLLTFLTHSFLISDGFDSSINTPRGAIINATFGEMYNLRSIAFVLINSPLDDDSGKYAGPPFLMPYSMSLPIGETNRWKLHADLVDASGKLITSLLAMLPDDRHHRYLYSLREADKKLKEIAMGITTAAV
jgi:hypothetical protein